MWKCSLAESSHRHVLSGIVETWKLWKRVSGIKCGNVELPEITDTDTDTKAGSCRSRCLEVTNMSVARRARGQPSPHCHWFHCNTTGIWIFVFSPLCFPLLFNGVCFKTKSRMQLVILQWIYIFLDFLHCVLLRCSSNTTWKTTLKDNFCLGSEFFLWQIWKIDLLFEPSQKFEQRKNAYFCFV